MFSVGIDLIEIDRIKHAMKHKAFLEKIFGEAEYLELKERKFAPQSIAVNFCAKEAFLKSLGKGLGSLRLSEIELLRRKNGQPYLKLSGKTLEFAEKEKLHFSVSATHTQKYASVVILAYRCK